jgi:energy-coupling factor transporter transmembrane protein EcfT
VFDLLYTPLDGERRAQDILYRLDPRTKMFSAALLVLGLAIVSQTQVMLLALAGVHLLGALSRGTRTRLVLLWRGLWVLPITIIVLGSLRWNVHPALLAVGPISVTWLALWRAVGVAARIVAASVGVSLLLWTTEPGELATGMTRLGVPFVIGFSMVMTLQYVLTFQRTSRQILEAQQSRGLILPRGNPIRAARTYIPVVVPLLISALRSVDSLTLALMSRGFGAGARRTSRRALRMRVRDWAFLLGACTVCAGLIWFDRTIRL